MPQHLFSTKLGCCGIAWNESGIAGFQLPDADPARTASRLAAQSGEAEPADPPPAIARIVAQVQDHLGGRFHDFAALPYDWNRVTPFQRRVYCATAAIPAGSVLTYGDIARKIGAKPGASRAVGGALGANPWPILIPCHRVVGAGGRLTGFSGYGGNDTKAWLLALEGCTLPLA